jgi:cell division protein FtsI (penicillin-binding protein 3)
VTDHDSVDTGNGILKVPGRSNPIRDEHLVGRAPLSEVLRWSSNIGIVKFAQRLRGAEEYETLRDFGFGVPTGLPYPTESGGTLRSPKAWSSQSQISMAMGYEIAVTPLQLATAYATFANGGQLVEPALVKEIIGPDGVVRYHHQPRVLRRVLKPAVADKVRRMLLDVVDEGTALKAAIDNYRLAGKTGTPRRAVHGRYDGTYNPNFVSLFPGDNPQYVIVVKLTAPQSSIFAAETAAPVTKAILQAAVAAGNAALDRGKLASSVVPAAKTTPSPTVAVRQMAQALPARASARPSVHQNVTPDTVSRDGNVPFVATLPSPPSAPPPRTMKPVPDVSGMVLRDAVRSLHNAGFRVQLARAVVSGASGSATSPAAGELAPTGTLVRLLFEY